jgi:hypothetical protein
MPSGVPMGYAGPVCLCLSRKILTGFVLPEYDTVLDRTIEFGYQVPSEDRDGGEKS